MDIKVEVRGAKEFEQAIKEVERKFPDEVIKILDKKATDLEELIREDSENQGIVNTGKLRDSYKHFKPEKKGGEYVATVDSKVPYAHLIEEGHELVLYSPKKKDGGKAHHLGRVKGYFPVENAVDELNDTYDEEIERWVYDLLDNGINW
ncbi:MAG: HK97 gp10 family phage protein [Peptostreptococcus porci]|uniref:HK97 gp10 family phage protein n=1 Tax=Peptostreptococcus porci TaxID=2652282 RepID=A0A6N7X240_9FIRM|nr:HK97 gp10 family phage protein [Peptostreptococcus porci]MDY5479001.1 HK97 gp10 family phage protein [Peptostreptococcus porci]MST63068.1 HK97 gp10 family phage protein [Peptostreptococcus porci]